MRKLLFLILIMVSTISFGLSDPRDIYSDQRYYSALFKDFPVGICFVREDGQFLAANASLCGFLGRTENELVKLKWQDVTVRQDIEVDEASARKVATRQERSYTMFKQYVHKRGESLWARITVNGIWSEDGKFEHFVTVVEPLSSSGVADADIINKLESIQGNLSKLNQTSSESASKFIANNWQTLITWFILAAISIGGAVYKIRLDDHRITALEKEKEKEKKKLDEDKAS